MNIIGIIFFFFLIFMNNNNVLTINKISIIIILRIFSILFSLIILIISNISDNVYTINNIFASSRFNFLFYLIFLPHKYYIMKLKIY